MATLGFVCGFTGIRVRDTSHVYRKDKSAATLRCEMGDSVAPRIRFTDTRNDATSKILIEWETVYPNTSDAVTVTGNMALNIALRSRARAPRGTPVEKTSEPIPEGISIVDYYFPKEYRNIAPFIDLASRESIFVEMKAVNPKCGGYEANEPDSVAFWKKFTTKPKYFAPEVAASKRKYDEDISTIRFEKYFPSKIRNRAPFINIRKPSPEWRKMPAFVEVGNSYVELNSKLATELTIQAPEGERDVRAASAVAKYF